MKADFINNMTHEFKTPVATISLAIDSILHKEIINKPDQIEKFGSIIKKENPRMNNQIERLLNIALFDKESFELNRETVNVHQLLLELKENFEINTNNQSGDFALFLNAEKAIILADKMHFYNVLRNIIDNGIKFSNEAFRIKVTTLNTNQSLIIRISDQGIGMNKDTQSKIFTRFYRKTEGDIHATKGFGLGLTYVKEVIEKMRAMIAVESELNKGTTFTITIPLD
ncbi:MAG: HAMP domain-containing histidine kinase [Flavobacteriales bacterium]|nr:HAMP domain-containing histidine kinase [Flavobacteriales bacterium]